MKTLLRISKDVLVFRLKRFEIGHLLVAYSLVLALPHDFQELILRISLIFLLYFFIHLNNDYCDLDIDQFENRAPKKTQFLRKNKQSALVLQYVVALITLIIAFFSHENVLFPVIVGTISGFLYSFRFKRHPFIDLITNAIWPAMMVLVAVPDIDSGGVIIAFQISIFTMFIQVFQLKRDYDHDKLLGIKNTLSLIGPDQAWYLTVPLALLNIIFSIFFIHEIIGWILLPLLYYSLRNHTIQTTLLGVRAVFGGYWLGILWQIYFNHEIGGLLKFI